MTRRAEREHGASSARGLWPIVAFATNGARSGPAAHAHTRAKVVLAVRATRRFPRALGVVVSLIGTLDTFRPPRPPWSHLDHVSGGRVLSFDLSVSRETLTRAWSLSGDLSGQLSRESTIHYRDCVATALHRCETHHGPRPARVALNARLARSKLGLTLTSTVTVRALRRGGLSRLHVGALDHVVRVVSEIRCQRDFVVTCGASTRGVHREGYR